MSPKVTCYRCGGNHLAPNCRFIEAVCRECNKKGHLARVCRSKHKEGRKQEGKPLNPHSRPNYMEEAQARSEEKGTTGDRAYTMFALSEPSTQPFEVKVELCGWETTMQIDTGISLTIVSKETYRDLTNSGLALPMEDSTALLTTYSGEC